MTNSPATASCSSNGPMAVAAGLTRYVLLNMVTGGIYPLFVGRNVIGRSATPLDDLLFINLESPRSAISRTHAVVLVAPNGDVWVCDNNSTNGTILSFREGLGAHLEPLRFYQCVIGARIVVGDVALSLVVDNRGEQDSSLDETVAALKTYADQQAMAAGIPAHFPRTLSDMPVGVIRARSGSQSSRRSSGGGKQVPQSDVTATSNAAPQVLLTAASADRLAAQMLDETSALKGETRSAPSSTRTSGNAAMKESKDIPYLSDVPLSAVTPLQPTNPQANAKNRKTIVDAAKPKPKKTRRTGDDEDNDIVSLEPQKKQARKSDSLLPPVKVCLSGFDSKQKDALIALVKQRKGTICEAVSSDIDALVVKDPPVRTPKFLIAIGCGVPVVTANFLEDGASVEDAAKYMPDLFDNTVRYTSKKLNSVIATVKEKRKLAEISTGVLDDDTFYLCDAIGSSKPVLADVIKGCGGRVSLKKGGGSDIIPVSDADEVYHKILTGAYIDNI